IKSLIEHAMALDITEAIHLYWIATPPKGHYMENLCRSWADALDDFRFTALTAGSGRGTNADWEKLPNDLIESLLMRVVVDYPHLGDFNLYIVGPDMVISAAKSFYANLGVPNSQLFLERMT
ncbi:MAG: ferredoxin, partial [Gammaproteobacteria bacterium]